MGSNRVDKCQLLCYDCHKIKTKSERTILNDLLKRGEKRAYCIEYLGGKCVVCGTIHNLQFDHIKREGKKYEITRKLTNKFDNLKEELDKCQLLCAPCHLEKTAKEWADITHKTVPVFKVSITY